MLGSKILPNHCAPGDVRKYTEAMLERLQVDSLDLLMVGRSQPASQPTTCSMLNACCVLQVCIATRHLTLTSAISPSSPKTQVHW